MSTYSSETWLGFVSGNKGDLLMAMAYPTMVVIGRVEFEKLVICYCCTSPMAIFWAFFRLGRGSSAMDLSPDLFSVLRGVSGVSDVASSCLGWLGKGLQVSSFLCTFMF